MGNEMTVTNGAREVSDVFAGVLLGTAAGDALGLPREGLSRRRAARMFGDGALRHRFFFGHGLCSDDTEHAVLVAQALLKSGGDPDAFARSLAWRLRWWLLGLPAGVGLATLRSIIRLWVGFSPQRSGVFSAGNGPAMRAPLLGVYAKDRAHLKTLVHASTCITHRDPKAEQGALAIALAAQLGAQQGAALNAADVFTSLYTEITDNDLLEKLKTAEAFLKRGASPQEFADALSLQRGVTGYMYHTVPVALYCWLRSPADFRQAVEDVVRLGGDADTTGAIVGGLAGATVGAAGIPEEWLAGICEWPRSVRWMRGLAEQLAQPAPDARYTSNVRLAPAILCRNLIFMLIVLAHGFRRLLPPY